MQRCQVEDVNEVSGVNKEILSVEEVAEYLGVKPITVYRWCREERLPCMKISKHWRIRRAALEDFLRRGERPVTLVGQLRSFLQVPDHVIGVAQNLDLLHRLDAAFFRVGEAQDGFLVKFYGGEEEPAHELRAQLKHNGLAVERLEEEGRFLIRAERDPLGGREDELRRLLDEEVVGERTVWVSFDWTKQVDLDTALRQRKELAELVDARQLVVKTAALEAAVGHWPPATLRRAQVLHSGTIWISEDGLGLWRMMPLSSV